MRAGVRSCYDFGFDPNFLLLCMRKRNPGVAFDRKRLSTLSFNEPSQYAEECGTTNKIINNAHKLDLRSISGKVQRQYTTYGCCGGSAPIGACSCRKTASRSRNSAVSNGELETCMRNQGGSFHTQEDRSWLIIRLRHHLAAAYGCTFWQGALSLSCFTRSLPAVALRLSIPQRLQSLRPQASNWRQPLANNPTTHTTPTSGGRSDASAVLRGLIGMKGMTC